MSNKQLQTFISYSRTDQQFALRLAYELKSANFAIWMDQYDIATGARWDDEIEKALRKCEIFMFIMTPASVVSENAKDELGFAIDHGKYILPVLLEDCEIPLRLTRLQYVDFTQKSFDEGIQSAKDLLSNLLNEAEVIAQDNSSSPPNDTDEKKELHAVKEPITVPSKKGAKSYSSQIGTTKIGGTKGRNKQILIWVLAGIVGIIGLLMGSTLVFPKIMPPPTTQTATATPTQALTPTYTLTPTIILATQTPATPRSFTENFDNDISWSRDWILQFRHGNSTKEKNFEYVIKDGSIVFDVSYEYVWGYFLYNTSDDYKNVEIEAIVEDLKSTDTFALVCQYSDKGWYEFDINGGGEYYVRYVKNMDSNNDEKEKIIKSGAIQGFRYSWQESSENIIKAICAGNNLALIVNDIELLDYPSDLFILEQGQIGIALRSYENTPVHVAVKSITVREP